ncbi:MAG: N-formylglutamate amidohydrolase [Bacteroidetes bacterium]|nr:N-formylglutamate amidohydrolase [Bacteroidota bacterium]
MDKILQNIAKGAIFEAETEDRSVYLRIEKYVPFICTAIHHGHNFREELKDKILLNGQERWYEEDPNTGDCIASMPVVLRCNDSRYEYDVNRSPDECIYKVAWGKKVWKEKLTAAERRKTLSKYDGFYRILHALVSHLENRFNACLVFDVHSYNYKRHARFLPVFNIGTARIDSNRFGKYIELWRKELLKIELPDIENVVALDDIFNGEGYMATYIAGNFKNTLVFPTEIKKVYCDENTGVIFPMVIRAIGENLKNAILNTANYFTETETVLKGSFNGQPADTSS